MNLPSSHPSAAAAALAPMSAVGTANYQFQPKNPNAKYVGLGLVVGLHVLVAWALLSGLGKTVVEVIKKPLEAVVIAEVKLPPPPPPPPPPPKQIEQPKPQPKVEAPPPPFVPPPDITPPAVTNAPAIVAAPEPPKEAPVIAPPPPPAPPAPAPAPPARAEIGVACPTQVKPEMPRRALQEGVSGVVRAQATISGGGVKEVQILSGPRVYHAAVRQAMMQYKCSAPDGTQAIQEFEFKVD